MGPLRPVGGTDQIEEPSTELTVDTERSVVGTLLSFPEERHAVEDVLAPIDFLNPKLGAAYEAILACSAPKPSIQDVARELERAKRHEMVGGAAMLSEWAGTVATPLNLAHEARVIRHYARIRRLRREYERAASGSTFDQDEIGRLYEEVRRGTDPEASQIEHPIGFVGPSLDALRERPEPRSPLPGFLDPEPGLHVLVGQSSTGKTTLGAYLALCWSCGIAPWDGAPPLPGGRALILSREQNVLRIDRRCRQLDLCIANLRRETWTERISIVARDPHLPRPIAPLLRLDDKGIDLLRSVLREARSLGDPYGFALLDSLSRLKPADCEENSNDDMTRWLDTLEEVAEEFGIYLVLLHHKHKMEGASSRTAARGASAIDAVAQGTWILEATDEPYVRRLKVHGNALDERVHEFEVAPEEDPGKILFWRLRAQVGLRPIEGVLGMGERVSLSELAGRLTPDRAGPPTAAMREQAKRVAYAWERVEWVEVVRPQKNGHPMTIERTGGPDGRPEVATGGDEEWGENDSIL